MFSLLILYFRVAEEVEDVVVRRIVEVEEDDNEDFAGVSEPESKLDDELEPAATKFPDDEVFFTFGSDCFLACPNSRLRHLCANPSEQIDSPTL